MEVILRIANQLLTVTRKVTRAIKEQKMSSKAVKKAAIRHLANPQPNQSGSKFSALVTET